jgi:hypothetical protein
MQTLDNQIGAISARLEILERAHVRLESKIEQQLRDMQITVGAIHDVLTSNKGAVKAVAAICAFSSGLGVLIFGFMRWWAGK